MGFKEEILKGFDSGKMRLKGEKISEANNKTEIVIKADNKNLLHATVFDGMGYYKKWIEFYGINDRLSDDFRFAGSQAEKDLVDLASKSLSSAESFFIEYYYDEETTNGLIKGFPPPVTRLGFMLFKNGFTWFKDWYYAEGWSEGGQKLQGEKSKSKNKEKQLKKIRKEVKAFLETDFEKSIFLEKAMERAEKI